MSKHLAAVARTNSLLTRRNLEQHLRQPSAPTGWDWERKKRKADV